MTTSSTFDLLMDRVGAGERLGSEDLAQLAASPDILQLGMLADTVRRRLHGAQVTYIRVALCPYDASFTDVVPLAAREVRVTGSPESSDIAVTAVEAARAVAGDRTVSAFSWADVERLAAVGARIPPAVGVYEDAGPGCTRGESLLDRIGDPSSVLEPLVSTGYTQIRLTIDKAGALPAPLLFSVPADLQEKFPAIRSINPLPTTLEPCAPPTGYDDVKSVAIARACGAEHSDRAGGLAAVRPKLAQVALTFGPTIDRQRHASDEAPDGPSPSAARGSAAQHPGGGLEPRNATDASRYRLLMASTRVDSPARALSGLVRSATSTRVR
jgi:hypothetical protein